MSLLLSVITLAVILQQYWTNYGGEAAWHVDQWSLLKALGVAVLVAAVVHRIVWIILNKFDDQFNHPAPLYTDMSPTRAYDSIRSRIKDSYYLESDELDSWVKEIDASRTFDLVDANPFLKSVETGGYESWRGVSGFRGLDNLGGPLGAIFRMMSSVTWLALNSPATVSKSIRQLDHVWTGRQPHPHQPGALCPQHSRLRHERQQWS